MLYVNDLSGDPDGLFSAVHAVLSPSIDLRGIIGTGTGAPGETAARSAALAHEFLGLMDLAIPVPVFEGSPRRLPADGTPIASPGVQAIIDEAMRADSALPLFVAVGGGLTEVASAIKLEPRIAGRFTLIWIGGSPYPAGGKGETNFMIDPVAAQFLFNQTETPIWQVPSDVYATCEVSETEIQAYVAPYGAVGAWLYGKLAETSARLGKYHLNTGETWTLGDSPLVVLTALNDWVPSGGGRTFRYERTGSSHYEEVRAPHLNPDGTYAPSTGGRMIRVYRSIDTRMMFSDFFAKLKVRYGA